MGRLALGILSIAALLSPAGAQAPPATAAPEPLYIQADELAFEAHNKRVVSRGNVELYFDNHIVTADEVVFDSDAKTLVAAGKVQHKDPTGNISRADRMELAPEFVAAFRASVLAADSDTRIFAPLRPQTPN